MAHASYLQRRDGRYQLQIRFTRAMVQLAGRPLFRVSLRTSCYRTARRRLAECLPWFLRMNDTVVDYPGLFLRNVDDLRRYLEDAWPLSEESPKEN